MTSKKRGLGLVKRYLGVTKLKTVFSKVKSAKVETLNMLREFVDLYGDDLNKTTREHCLKYIHCLETRNKLSAILWGMKKVNRQSGFIKNIYFWGASIK